MESSAPISVIFCASGMWRFTTSSAWDVVFGVLGVQALGFRVCLTGSLTTVGFGLAVVSGPVDSLGTLVNMCKCAGRASILCTRTDGNE